jgi:hypothetical protein
MPLNLWNGYVFLYCEVQGISLSKYNKVSSLPAAMSLVKLQDLGSFHCGKHQLATAMFSHRIVPGKLSSTSCLHLRNELNELLYIAESNALPIELTGRCCHGCKNLPGFILVAKVNKSLLLLTR